MLRVLKLNDLLSIHKLYYSLSPESENYYNSQIYGKPKSFIWLPAQFALIISHIGLKNLLLRLWPKYIYFIIGAFDSQDNLVGFAHFVLHGISSDNMLIARVGIALRDDFQGQGIGSSLLSNLIDLALVNHVNKLILDVFADNHKAINLYKKYGFDIAYTKESEDISNERTVKIYRMELVLNRGVNI